MNIINWLRGKKTYGVIAISLLYLAGVGLDWWAFSAVVLSTFGIGAVLTLRLGMNTAVAGALEKLIGNNPELREQMRKMLQSSEAPKEEQRRDASATLPPDKLGTFAWLMLAGSLLAAGLVGLALTGCVRLTPGADALLVRAEQAQSMSAATFDLVLSVDNANRGFWRTNAPGYHGFCEWLRVPGLYASPEYGPTNVARAIMMQLQVDDLRRAYKERRASSNALWVAVEMLEDTVDAARAWEPVILKR